MGKKGTLTSPRGVLAKHRRSPPPPRDTNPSSVICWRSSTCKRQCPDPARVAPSGDARVAHQPKSESVSGHSKTRSLARRRIACGEPVWQSAASAGPQGPPVAVD